MIKSMTGYGKAEAVLASGKLTIEIRTLNSKSADISIKSSLLPKDKDILLRQKIAERLVRGTVDVFITLETNSSENAKSVDAELVRNYYGQLLEIRKTLPGFTMGSLEMGDRMNNELLTSVLRTDHRASGGNQDRGSV